MFKRIKNLLDISKYTVEEVVNKPTLYTTPDNTIEIKEYRPATIINLKETDPFADIPYETFEPSSNDTTPRN
jgi:hypothetical protein